MSAIIDQSISLVIQPGEQLSGFVFSKLDEGTNVGVYASKEQVVASGLVWDETRDQLAGKAFLMHQPVGDGHVVAFAEDPNYRGYAEATELLFMNAVLLGPAY